MATQNFLMVGTSQDTSSFVAVPAPDDFTWGLQDVSAPDAGRTQDANATMHKMLITQKRRIQLSWKNRSTSEVASILQAFNYEYVWLRYLDAMSGTYEYREFYTGDRSAALRRVGVHSVLSFNVIER